MTDYNSSLPIKTQNPGDVVSKIADSLIPSRQLKVNSDGSIDSIVSAVDLDVRDLDRLTDDVTAYDPTLTTRVDEVSKNLIYLGKAAIASSNASAVWQIQRITISGTITTTLWADGNSNYDNIWNDRASLTYT